MLQGPVGPFFGELARHLQANGAHVTRVCFNGGDLVYSGGVRRVSFFGNAVQWRARLDLMLTRERFTQILLFGSERPAHIAARKIALRHGVEVISLEEGYIRPGYIAVERGGNNASSPLAGRLHDDNYVPSPTPACGERYGGLTPMIRQAFIYYVARAVLGHGRHRELFHRPTPLAREAFCWSRNALRRLGGGNRNLAAIQHLLENVDGKYFLVPLQVAADGNMGRAARGWTTGRLMSESIASFARAAPDNARLVFKVHPMERGHNSLFGTIAGLAAAHGVSGRIDLIDTGSMGLLTRHCAGMITINSTSGLSAIHHGVPLLVIGDALYANPTLAICARGKPDFDGFWTSRHVADRALRETYTAWIREKALMPGDFYAPDGRRVACDSVVSSLMQSNAMVQTFPVGMTASLS